MWSQGDDEQVRFNHIHPDNFSPNFGGILAFIHFSASFQKGFEATGKFLQSNEISLY